MSVSRTMLTTAIVASLANCAPVLAGNNPASPDHRLADDAPTRSVFISGHSLTDRPFPDYLKDTAAAEGIHLRWKMHHIPGSSILQRLNDPQMSFTQTKASGKHTLQPDRDPASALDGQGFDFMIITEQHRVLDSLMWQDAVQSLRKYHDSFIAANETGKTFFFAPWISISDRADPGDWTAYEKEALPIWQCLVTQVNKDLASEARTDRIAFIPTSLALARLVEHMTANADLAGFEGLDTAAKMDAIFADDVHLTHLGTYYTAAISYSTMFSDDLPGLAPRALAADQAETLRAFATAFLQEYKNTTPLGEACSSGVSLAFASRYAAYTERTYHRKVQGVMAARLKRIRDTMRFAWRFSDGLK